MAKGLAMPNPKTRTLPLLAALACAPLLGGCGPESRSDLYERGGDVVDTDTYATRRGQDTYLDVQEFRPRGDPRYLCVHVFRNEGGSLSCFLSER